MKRVGFLVLMAVVLSAAPAAAAGSENSAPTASGTAADLVLGQASMTKRATARDAAPASGLPRPAASAASGGLSTASGAPTDVLPGQGDLMMAAVNEDDDDDDDDAQPGSARAAPPARALAYPSGVALAGSTQITSDTLNRHLLVVRLL